MHSRQESNPYPITRWATATRLFGADSASASHALGELGLRFAYPVYAFVRHCGHAPAIALDLAQGFLGHLYRDSRAAAAVRPEHFRRYLLERLRLWLNGDWREASIDDEIELPALNDAALEACYRTDGTQAESAEQAFQRGFALEVLAGARRRLRSEAQQAGRDALYVALMPFLGRDPVPERREELAATARIRPSELLLALARLRQRLRELALEELADTVTCEDELDAEREFLLGVLDDTCA